MIRDLLTEKITSVDTLVQLTAPYAYDHITSLYSSNDYLERQLLRVRFFSLQTQQHCLAPYIIEYEICPI